MKKIRYFLGSDNDGHHYVVPEDSREEWDAFCALNSDDEASWDVPKFAVELPVSPKRLTFTNPGFKGKRDIH